MKRQRGFTLMEVMIGLALLGVALTVLIKSAAGSIFSARQAQMMGVATDLSRGMMYEIEEKLLKDGFTETDQSEGDIGEPEKGSSASSDAKARSGKCFEDEGWPNVCYAYRVEQVELPSIEELQRMAQGRAQAQQGSGSAGSGSGEEAGGFENSALGGMLSMMGGFGGGGGKGGGDIEDAQGASFLQSQYSMVQQILKVSIRKVTLVVWWDVMGRTRDLKTVAFFTDATAMDKVLMGLGSQPLSTSGGSGSGSGSGSSSSGSGSSRPSTGSGTKK